MLMAKDVILSPLTVNDLPALFEWINDREQVLHNSPYKPVTEVEYRVWFESVQSRKDVFIFGIHLKETGKLIGSCQLHNINHVHRNAELQIRLGDVKARGKGHGSTVTWLLLEFAFNDLNLKRVYLHVFSTNASALRMYENVGFVREGLLRKAAHINGKYVDVIVMGILREEYNG